MGISYTQLYGNSESQPSNSNRGPPNFPRRHGSVSKWEKERLYLWGMIGDRAKGKWHSN